MLRKVARFSRLIQIPTRFISKETTELLIEEIKPKKTPFHIHQDGPDFPEFDNSRYGNWLPNSQDLVSQCLIPPDEPYMYQEIESFTLKVLQERKRTRPQNFLQDLPFDQEGADQIPLVSEKELISQFIKRNQIKREKIPTDLQALLKRSLALLGTNQEVSLAKYETLFQQQMAEKVKSRKQELRNQGVELRWDGTPQVQLEIQNSLFVKGVYIDRRKNGTNFDYIIEQKNEERGLQEYLHKYFMDDLLIYPLNALGSPNLKKFSTLLNRVHRRQEICQISQIIWKIVALVRMKQRLEAVKANQALHSYGSQYSDMHLVVFENELKTPPHITLCDLEFQDWVYSHRYYPWKWRISDIDFYMKGNPYYSARVDLRKMEQLKPQIQELPDFKNQSLSQIYGIKSVQAAKPTFTYPPIKIYHLEQEENEKAEEEEGEEKPVKEAKEDEEFDWEGIGPTNARIMQTKPWVPYVTENVYEQ